mmetsp:Transcript_2462/g.3734  ORF Transcript_2462/g.3734 Transcript_2462/m.3734 type:complete len:269 (-) Transcript_2462:348-1154(-)
MRRMRRMRRGSRRSWGNTISESILPLIAIIFISTPTGAFQSASRRRTLGRLLQFATITNAITTRVRRYWDMHDTEEVVALATHDVEATRDLLRQPKAFECRQQSLHATFELTRLAGVPRRRDDCHVHVITHQIDNVGDHLVVLANMGSIGVQRAVGVEGDELEGGGGGVDLSDVDDMPELGEVGRDISAAGEGEEGVVLFEGLDQRKRTKHLANVGDQTLEAAVHGVAMVLGYPALYFRHHFLARVRAHQVAHKVDQAVLLFQVTLST